MLDQPVCTCRRNYLFHFILHISAPAVSIWLLWVRDFVICVNWNETGTASNLCFATAVSPYRVLWCFDVYVWVAHLSGIVLAVLCLLNNITIYKIKSVYILNSHPHQHTRLHSLLRLSVFQFWILAPTALRPGLSVVTPCPPVKTVPYAVS